MSEKKQNALAILLVLLAVAAVIFGFGRYFKYNSETGYYLRQFRRRTGMDITADQIVFKYSEHAWDGGYTAMIISGSDDMRQTVSQRWLPLPMKAERLALFLDDSGSWEKYFSEDFDGDSFFPDIEEGAYLLQVYGEAYGLDHNPQIQLKSIEDIWYYTDDYTLAMMDYETNKIYLWANNDEIQTPPDYKFGYMTDTDTE